MKFIKTSRFGRYLPEMGVDAHEGVEQEDDEELVGHALSGLRCPQERVQGADDHLLRALDGRQLSSLL